jgi:hypothetical protein
MNNALNLREINQEEAFNLGKFFISAGKNVFLFGRRGVGKSEISMQIAEACKLQLIYINLSVIERSDLMGYPNMQSIGDTITFKSPAYLPALQEGSEADSIILFDEVDKTQPEITAPLLEILQFKSINGKPLNIVGCILTGNLMNEGAYSNQISTALLDRGAKYILSFDFERWLEWAKAHQVHDLILGFLRSDPAFACGNIEDTNYASPSPRSWTLASEALLKTKELRMTDIESVTHIISGYVGNEAGTRFKTWYEYYRKFEPYIHALIDNNNLSMDFGSLAPTEKVVFVVSACYYAKQKVFSGKSKNKFMYLENLCNFFIKHNVDPEVQVIGLFNSFPLDQITKHKLYTCKIFFELFGKLQEGVSFKK